MVIMRWLSLIFLVMVGSYLLAPGTAATSSCPLDFRILENLDVSSCPTADLANDCRCSNALHGLHLLMADYLHRTSIFLPSHKSSKKCWKVYEFLTGFQSRSSCGFKTEWISNDEACRNITTRAELESIVPNSTLSKITDWCSQPLLNSTSCGSCQRAIDSIAAYLMGDGLRPGNKVTNCEALAAMYAVAFVCDGGPTNPHTAKCLFHVNLYANNFTGQRPRAQAMWWIIFSTGVSILFVCAVAASVIIKSIRRSMRIE